MMGRENFEPMLKSEKKNPRGEIKEAEKLLFEVETPYAKFFILYNIHIGSISAKLLPDVDGFVLERILTADPPGGSVADFSSEGLYKNIYQKAVENNIPVFFPDISSATLPKRAKLKKVLSNFIPAALGAAFGLKMIEVSKNELEKIKANRNASISRRDFIKSMAKIVGAGTLGLSVQLPTIGNVFDVLAASYYHIEPNETSKMILENSQKTPDLKDFPRLLFKGDIVSFGREYLMAQKCKTIATSVGKQDGEKPTFCFVIGAAHHMIVDALQMDENKRKEKLMTIFSREQLEKEKKIMRLDFLPSNRGSHIARVSMISDDSFIDDKK